MSCRIAVNMAKRAAAGAMSRSISLDERSGGSVYRGHRALISGTHGQHTARKAITLKYDRARIIIAAVTVFAALGFVSYAAYAHEWSELSALRHLGKPSPVSPGNAPH
jgi:hypothetical protein